MENNYQEERGFILKNKNKADVEVLRMYAEIKVEDKTEELIKLMESARTAQRNFYASTPGSENKRKWLRASKLYESMMDDLISKHKTPKLEL